MALYLSIWLLILKKLKVVYQLDGNNFGIFVSFVGYFRRRRDEKPKRTVSIPSIHRSTSIRERRRFHSDGGGLTNRKSDNTMFATQQFVLRKRKNTATTSTTMASEDAEYYGKGKQIHKELPVGRLKY